MAWFDREFIAVPEVRKNQLVYKWPDVNIRRYSRAIVNADEIALFVKSGQVVAAMGDQPCLTPAQGDVDIPVDENRTLVAHFGHGFPFFLYAGFCVAEIWFVWRNLPETKNRSLEEISRWWSVKA